MKMQNPVFIVTDIDDITNLSLYLSMSPHLLCIQGQCWQVACVSFWNMMSLISFQRSVCLCCGSSLSIFYIVQFYNSSLTQSVDMEPKVLCLQAVYGPNVLFLIADKVLRKRDKKAMLKNPLLFIVRHMLA